MTIGTALIFLIPLSTPQASDLCPLVAQLNAVIVLGTTYQPPPCPTIGFSVLPDGGAMRSQGGAFFPDTGAIELPPDLDLSTAYGQSFLLHELVHAAQFANGADRGATCLHRLEAEAYTLQSDFLRDHGLARDAALVRLMAAQLGQCDGDAY